MAKAQLSVKQKELTDLPESNANYASIAELMKNDIEKRGATINILSIQEIRHAGRAKKYAQCKERIAASANPNEKLLYHGSIDAHLIAKKGFDINLAKPSGLFGPGIYFAEDAYKSAGYADGMVFPPIGLSTMLMCLVLLGNEFTIKQFEKFNKPPQGFHSVHGVKGEKLIYDEYIVYDPDQILPRFVVTYDIL